MLSRFISCLRRILLLQFAFFWVVTSAHALERPVEIIEFKDLRDSSRPIPIKVHSPVGGGPYPVVILSHGAGGSLDGHYAVAHFLAEQGYVALCLEHTGSNTARLTRSFRIRKNLQDMIHDSNEVLRRPKDVSFALTQATEWNRSHPQLKGRLDLSRVGVLGHSFGAYTVLAVAGARPALDWLVPRVGQGVGLGPDLADSRVRCGVALSPQSPGEPFFHPESFKTLKIPVLGISGTEDEQSNGNPPIQRREAFQLWPEMGGRSAFVWITRASHMDFSDSTGSERLRRRSSSREDVQRVVRAASLAFFDQCLKGKKESGGAVSEAKLKPELGGSVRQVEVLRK